MLHKQSHNITKT